MSRSKPSPGDLAAPDDSLEFYFDELLGIGDLLDDALVNMAPTPMPKPEAETPVSPSSPVPRAVPSLTPVVFEPRPVARAQPARMSNLAVEEPAEVLQTPEQKRQLEKLLQSASVSLLTEAAVETTVETPVQVTERDSAFVADPSEIQEWDIETPDVTAKVETTAEPILAATENDSEAVRFQLDGVEWLENGRPQWAQSRFDVLLFTVAGLTLAVPLIALGQIQPLTDELTPLFGQADWFMGLQPTPAGKIRTVNTAKFVMPERYDDRFLQTARYVMSINGVPWGLAVDSVNQPITLDPEEVKWRSDRSKRPWLAGTVKEHMCALLDIPQMGQMLVNADKNFAGV